MPGGATLVATMKAHGAYAALVSGGFVSFDRHRGTARVSMSIGPTLFWMSADGELTGDVAQPILGRDAKVEALEEITARLGIGADDVIAIGDGANDLGMLERAGTGVAIHAKPSVQAAAQAPDQPRRSDVDPVSSGVQPRCVRDALGDEHRASRPFTCGRARSSLRIRAASAANRLGIWRRISSSCRSMLTPGK
jgi:hypothetical protein